MTYYTATLNNTINAIPITPQTTAIRVITMPPWLFALLAFTSFALIVLMIFEAFQTPNRRLAYLQSAFTLLLIFFSVAYNIVLGYVMAIGFAFASGINMIKGRK